jgi:midasin (ATPase involved in ribosome maturation)
MAKRPVDKTPFINAVRKELGDVKTITRAEVFSIMEKYGLKDPLWLTKNDAARVGRGVYSLDDTAVSVQTVAKAAKVVKRVKNVIAASEIASEVPVAQIGEVANQADLNMAALHTSEAITLVPSKAKGYVPFGHFSDVRMIIKSGKFYPTYVTGLSGNGKTMMIEQICAQEGRELVRANITKETDEDDLIGGFRLIDGKTVWQNGPVIVAMERGAILLLDEVDLGDAKLMCLQPVLEGKPIYLKKINRVITPAAGFNILATANTKGKGSDDGRFIGTNVMNEAFLERFSITFEQEYPPLKTEAKILNNVLGASGIEDKDFADKLVNWADMIRKAFYDGAVSDIISTRRLVHICEAFAIFGQDREKAIKLCLNRFDVDTKNGFMDLYMKLDETINPKPVETPVEDKLADQEVAF